MTLILFFLEFVHFLEVFLVVLVEVEGVLVLTARDVEEHAVVSLGVTAEHVVTV